MSFTAVDFPRSGWVIGEAEADCVSNLLMTWKYVILLSK